MVVIDMTDIHPDVLKRYAEGKCTVKERQLVEDWLENEDRLPDAQEQVVPSLLKSEIWDGLTFKVLKQGTRLTWIKYVAGIAATSILVLSLNLFFKIWPKQDSVQQETYMAPVGKIVTMKLGDGTIVQLTGGSKFSYPTHFSGQTRTVNLLSGEAFFKVKHNAQQPFIVCSSGAEVKVLGTRFNVSNLKGRSLLAVTLTEGCISFKVKDKQETILKPGQQLIFNKALKKIQSVKEVDTLYATGWTMGLFWFKQTPVTEILERLEAYYGVNFEMRGDPDLQVHLTGKFKQQSLSRILKLIENSSELRFEQQHKKILVYKAN